MQSQASFATTLRDVKIDVDHVETITEHSALEQEYNVANELKLLIEKAKKHDRRLDELYKSGQEQHRCHHDVEKKLVAINEHLDSKNTTVSERVDVVEKLLKFSNLQRDPMQRSEMEQYCMEYVDEAFKPTQQRVLELQTKMGMLASEEGKIRRELKGYKEEMDEALGTSGRGPLKAQILADV